MMFKLGATKTYLVVLIILNLLVIGFYLFFLGSINNGREEAALLREELDFEVLKEGRLKSVKDLVSDTEIQREKLDRYFVGQDLIVDFIKTVEGLADITGVSLEINSVGVEGLLSEDKVLNDNIELLNLDLTTNGSWDENFYLISLIESLPYKVSFERLFLGKKASLDGGGSVWEGTISFNVLKIK